MFFRRSRLSQNRREPSRGSPTAARGKPRTIRPAKSVLDDEESAALRDRLIAELDDLTSADEAANLLDLRIAGKRAGVDPYSPEARARVRWKMPARNRVDY